MYPIEPLPPASPTTGGGAAVRLKAKCIRSPGPSSVLREHPTRGRDMNADSTAAERGTTAAMAGPEAVPGGTPCCSPNEPVGCCEPTHKATCCAPETTSSGACGCR
jgi:hypothetical protein